MKQCHTRPLPPPVDRLERRPIPGRGPATVVLALLVLGATPSAGQSRRMTEALVRARVPTPVWNTPDPAAVFGPAGEHDLRFDDEGLIRDLECIALPGTLFRVEDRGVGLPGILRVRTRDYPHPGTHPLYIDRRCVEEVAAPAPERRPAPRSRSAILRSLREARGTPYLWGGNWRAGIPRLLQWFPPARRLDAAETAVWQLAGLDCSGLLYESTDGATPRNCYQLARFGDPIRIAGRDPAGIADLLAPLDLIVWDAHVIVVLDGRQAIESRPVFDGTTRANRGRVRITDLTGILEELMEWARPVDDLDAARGPAFVVRRWFADPEPPGRTSRSIEPHRVSFPEDPHPDVR